jgi:hypothetical protein
MVGMADLCRPDWVAIGTWVLAAGTLGLYFETRRLVRTTREAIQRAAADSKTDLAVRLHMTMEEKWDGDAMCGMRARLAHAFLSKADHDKIQEAGVMDFFESLGILDRLGLIHRELVCNTFSFYVTRWWTVCKDYVFQEREKHREQNLPESFTEFEAFADRCYSREAQERKMSRATIEPGANEADRFLRDELALRPDVATGE